MNLKSNITKKLNLGIFIAENNGLEIIMKLPSRKFFNELMNKGHRYLVNSSIAFTLISTGLLGVLMVDRFLNSESAESQIDPIKQSSESLGTKNAQKNIG
ncbi:hypothetical protein QR98_0026250 [Sarcoptes scabiei]|uniref:Uncharacterized protein n=1 Tax=Sarcoptes scabiei TaxID=52283 RepID=A0A131ZZS5_SARSC|nr:hypothetical protein QR98_0026250 [Sarcoptes scabiei]